MKVNRNQLKKYGLDALAEGRQLSVPLCFQKEIGLLFETSEGITAVVQAKHFKDYAIYAKIMCLLNQLVRYYQKSVTIYCLSYRTQASKEKKYLVFTQKPENITGTKKS